MDIVLVFFVSLFSTLLSVMSGGGSSTIGLPIFLEMGMSVPLAVCVHKFCAVFWAPVSAYNYLKGRKIDWGFVALFSVIGLVGAYFGAEFVLQTEQDVLKRIIGVVILIFVTYTYFKKDLGLKGRKIKSKIVKGISYLVALVMGFYESILGSGNGIAFSILTFHTRGFDFISALGHYFAVGFLWVSFASYLFIKEGYFDWEIMGAAVLGSVIGSYVGSKYARYKGNSFIKAIFVVLGAILGLKLVLGL